MSNEEISVAKIGLRHLHGRGMNTTSEDYKLPGDEREINRLTLQNEMWKLLLLDGSGLYHAEAEELVNKVLAIPTSSARPKEILDVGYGSGSWLTKMVAKYPHVRALGIDFNEWKPPNAPKSMTFVQGDANEVLKHYPERFDIVHARTVLGHAKDSLALLESMRKSLKPGGVILLEDGMWKLFDENEEYMPGVAIADLHLPAENHKDVKGSWLATWMREVGIGMKNRSHRNITGREMGWALSGDGHFENIREKALWCPITWNGEGKTKNPHGSELRQINKLNFTEVIESSKPLLLNGELKADEVDILCQRAIADLNDDMAKVSICWFSTWAVKKMPSDQ